jgi:hypothetical protein
MHHPMVGGYEKATDMEEQQLQAIQSAPLQAEDNHQPIKPGCKAKYHYHHRKICSHSMSVAHPASLVYKSTAGHRQASQQVILGDAAHFL